MTNVKIERVVPSRGTSVHEIDLSTEVGSAEPVRDGDVLRVLPNLEILEDAVRLVGNAQQPGLYQWRDGMRLVDLIPFPERLKPLSDLNYVLIRREAEPNVAVDAVSADLQAAWQQPGGPNDLVLEPRDTIYVFNLEIGREHIVGPLLEELRARALPSQPIDIARIGGDVRAPGEYPLEPGMRLTDLIRAGGGLAESAYALDAELTHYDVVGGEFRETQVLNVDLAAALSGSQGANMLVSSHDYLGVRRIPQWLEQQTVELVGEFRFPGVYPIRQGETLTSVLDRAGGFTEHAFVDGSVFLRVELREREREQLQGLASQIQTDLATLAISDEGSPELAAMGQTLVEQLNTTDPAGRLVVDLGRIISRSAQDVMMRNGDRLFVPEASQSVTVLGEVQFPTSHLYEAAFSRNDYLDRSGGLTSRADKRRIYIVRANGEVIASGRSSWFSRSGEGDVQPGDAIIVPLDVFAGRRLTFWASATQILYNIAIAITAVDSFGR